MKVVLKNNVDGVGRRGDIVDVADGYGRNYLIPQGLAMRATQGVEREAEQMRKAQAARDLKDRESAQIVANQLATTPMVIAARASDEGRLFGSVGVSEILGAAAHSGIELDRRSVLLDEPIKDLGDHSVTIDLHTDVQVAVSVTVIPDEA